MQASRIRVILGICLATAGIGSVPASKSYSADIAAAVLEGPFPLLVTPWTEKAELDVPVLVKEAEFVERTGVGGIIWPTAGEVGSLDRVGEYEAGLQALAERAAKPGAEFTSHLTAICPGKTSAEAVARVKKVEAIARRTGAKMAILDRDVSLLHCRF